MKQYNQNIQGLRGILALIVFSGHATGAFYSTTRDAFLSSPLGFMIDGGVAVTVFFVLSGFFYYNEAKVFSFKLFCLKAIRRILKLVPPYWVVLVFGSIICNFYYVYSILPISDGTSSWFVNHWTESISLNKFLHELLIVHRGYEIISYVDPPSWYLESDIKMMVVFPFIIFLFNKTRWSLSWYYICLACLVKLFSDDSFLTLTIDLTAILLLGALVHRYIGLFANLCRNPWGLAFLLILSFLLLDVYHLIDTSAINGWMHPVGRLFPIAQAVGAALLIGTLINKNNFSFFSNRIMVWLGNISYEFYICHFVLMMALRPFVFNAFVFYFLCMSVSIMVSVTIRHCRLDSLSNSFLSKLEN